MSNGAGADGGAAGGDTGGGAGAGGAGGTGGSAADVLLGGDAGAGSGGEAASGAAAGSDAGAGTSDAGTGGADPAWYNDLSADTADGETASLRDWVKSQKAEDVNHLAKIARDNQRALRESGRIKVPGEGASTEEVKAYHAAIGVPETVDGYKLDPVKDAAGNDVPLQTALLDRLAAKALADGMPAGAYKGVVGEFIQAQLEEFSGHEAAMKAEASDWLKAQGDKAPAQSAAINRAAAALGLGGEEVAKVRNALGAKRTAEVLAKLGGGIGEDVLLGGEANNAFLVSGDQAQAQIDRMKADPAVVSKITIKGSPENVKYERLQAIAGEAANRKKAAGM